MVNSENQIATLREFFDDYIISNEWFMLHTDIKFNDREKSITIKIDNINEQEYELLKET